MKWIAHFKSKKLYFYIFIVLFVGVGTFLAVSEAAPKEGYSGFRNRGSLQVNYSDEKPVTLVKGSGGKITYVSRPRNISISSDNTLFCTPEDNGQITSRGLSASEQKLVKDKIVDARANNLQTGDKGPGSNINDEKVVFLRDGAAGKAIDEKAGGANIAYLNGTINFLEDLCAVPSNPVNDTDVPEWTDNSASKTSSLTGKVKAALVPTANAGGETTINGVDAAAENQQHYLINQARQQAGLPSYTRSDCLDKAAREWASVMARDRWMRHSNPISALPNKYCGDIWAALGENVGWYPTPYSVNPADSIQTSTTLFGLFMASAPHKANIMSTTFTQLGVGAYKSADGKQLYMTHVFMRPQVVK